MYIFSIFLQKYREFVSLPSSFENREPWPPVETAFFAVSPENPEPAAAEGDPLPGKRCTRRGAGTPTSTIVRL